MIDRNVEWMDVLGCWACWVWGSVAELSEFGLFRGIDMVLIIIYLLINVINKCVICGYF